MWRAFLARSRTFADWIGAGERERLRSAIGWLFLALVIASLAVQLNRIGWAELWATRPTEPLFYLFVLLAYLTLPAADALIYRSLWHVPWLQMLATCLRKRIYNSALVGYSGEVFLLVWARGRVGRSDAELAHEIKDSNILSALVSTYVTAALLVYLLYRGAFSHVTGTTFEAWVAVTLVIAALTPIVFLFRRHFMVLSARTALQVLAIHFLRFLVVQAFLLGQWHVELAQTPFATLVALLAVQMLVSRIPVIPNRDLLFVSVGIALSGSLDLPQAQIAGLLVTTTALQQVLHLVVVLATSLRSPRRARLAPR